MSEESSHNSDFRGDAQTNPWLEQFGNVHKSELWRNSIISTTGNLAKETWNTDSKEHKHPYVHCSVIYNQQDMKLACVHQ